MTVRLSRSGHVCDRSLSSKMKSRPPDNCCDMAFDRMLLVINKACRRRVKIITVKGRQVPESYALDGYHVLPLPPQLLQPRGLPLPPPPLLLAFSLNVHRGMPQQLRPSVGSSSYSTRGCR